MSAFGEWFNWILGIYCGWSSRIVSEFVWVFSSYWWPVRISSTPCDAYDACDEDCSVNIWNLLLFSFPIFSVSSFVLIPLVLIMLSSELTFNLLKLLFGFSLISSLEIDGFGLVSSLLIGSISFGVALLISHPSYPSHP